MTLPEPFAELIGFLKANDFASGGLLVGSAGVVIAALRNLPGRIVRFLWRQVSLEVVIQNGECGKARAGRATGVRTLGRYRRAAAVPRGE